MPDARPVRGERAENFRRPRPLLSDVMRRAKRVHEPGVVVVPHLVALDRVTPPPTAADLAAVPRRRGRHPAQPLPHRRATWLRTFDHQQVDGTSSAVSRVTGLIVAPGLAAGQPGRRQRRPDDAPGLGGLRWHRPACPTVSRVRVAGRKACQASGRRLTIRCADRRRKPPTGLSGRWSLPTPGGHIPSDLLHVGPATPLTSPGTAGGRSVQRPHCTRFGC